MWDMMWIYTAIIISLSEAKSLDRAPALTGITQSTAVNSSNTSNLESNYERGHTKFVRNLTFNLGSEANLTCSDKTWNETIYVLWKIELKSKYCEVNFASHDTSGNSCNDGKSLRNTSSGQSYLHIPNISDNDVGVYNCELAYKGGNDDYKINVAITVPPNTLLWLEQNDKMAVCRAERGKPAANISWSHVGNVSTVETLDSNGLVTVESRLELPEGMDLQNLSCVIRHPYWEGENIVSLKSQKAGYLPFLCIATVVVILLSLAFGIFFAKKKLLMMRRCAQSVISPSKSPSIEDVEEVEPYASYIQRVNSIYN